MVLEEMAAEVGTLYEEMDDPSMAKLPKLAVSKLFTISVTSDCGPQAKMCQ